MRIVAVGGIVEIERRIDEYSRNPDNDGVRDPVAVAAE